MNWSDETLMAYVDGEADAAASAAIEQAAASDAALAARIERMRRLRAAVHAAYAPVLDEPVPDRLLAALQAAPAAPNVIDLAARRAAKTAAPRPRWSWFEWGAMAASVLLGVALGAVALREPGEPIVAERGGLVARAALAQALSAQLAQDLPTDAPVRIGLSFVSKAGEYCRTFSLAQRAPVAGLACRSGDDWRVIVVVQDESAAAPDRYRMAATPLPRAVLDAVDAAIAGDPLDAEAERAARERGWRR
jgi:anti-sigma factor RsiW